MIPIANPDLGQSEVERVSDVIDSGMVAAGSIVEEFEDAFAEYCETEYAAATSNGTTALHAAIEALNLDAGDRVVTTPFSYIASSNTIRLAGAEPVFADIDENTFNIDPASVRQIVETQEIDALLVVHLYGLPCDMDELTKIAAEHDIPLIEDCAQAHGATYNDQPVGSFGDAGCFSFYPTKNMTTGEGGMIVTDRDDVVTRAESFANHGRPPEGGYEHVRLGHNFRMTNIAAAIGIEQLEKLPEFLVDRRQNAQRLTEGIDEDIVDLPMVPSDRTHAYHQYTIRTDTRDALLDHLHDHGVGAKIYYPKCIHQQPAYDSENYEYECPVAEQAAKEVLSLPVHPNLSDEEVESIIDTVNSFDERS